MTTPTQLALYDQAVGGKRIGTLEISDLTTITSINYGQDGKPTDKSHVITLSLAGSGAAFFVLPLGTTTDQFIQDWCDAVVQGGGGGANATALQGVPISATDPVLDQALVYDGNEWVPTTQVALVDGNGDVTVIANDVLDLAATSGTGEINFYTGGVAPANLAMQVDPAGIVIVNPNQNTNNDFIVKGENLATVLSVDVTGAGGFAVGVGDTVATPVTGELLLKRETAGVSTSDVELTATQAKMAYAAPTTTSDVVATATQAKMEHTAVGVSSDVTVTAVQAEMTHTAVGVSSDVAVTATQAKMTHTAVGATAEVEVTATQAKMAHTVVGAQNLMEVTATLARLKTLSTTAANAGNSSVESRNESTGDSGNVSLLSETTGAGAAGNVIASTFSSGGGTAGGISFQVGGVAAPVAFPGEALFANSKPNLISQLLLDSSGSMDMDTTASGATDSGDVTVKSETTGTGTAGNVSIASYSSGGGTAGGVAVQVGGSAVVAPAAGILQNRAVVGAGEFHELRLDSASGGSAIRSELGGTSTGSPVTMESDAIAAGATASDLIISTHSSGGGTAGGVVINAGGVAAPAAVAGTVLIDASSLIIAADLIPSPTNTHDIGSSSLHWAATHQRQGNVYGDTGTRQFYLWGGTGGVSTGIIFEEGMSTFGFSISGVGGAPGQAATGAYYAGGFSGAASGANAPGGSKVWHDGSYGGAGDGAFNAGAGGDTAISAGPAGAAGAGGGAIGGDMIIEAGLGTGVFANGTIHIGTGFSGGKGPGSFSFSPAAAILSGDSGTTPWTHDGTIALDDGTQVATYGADGISLGGDSTQRFFIATATQNTGISIEGHGFGLFAGAGSVASGAGVGGKGGPGAVTSGKGGDAAGGNDAGDGGEGSHRGGEGGDSDGVNAAGIGGLNAIRAGDGGFGSGGIDPGLGGLLELLGGEGGTGGTGNADGGAVSVRGGPGQGTGTDGTVSIGLTNTATTDIGGGGLLVASFSAFSSALHSMAFAHNGGQGGLGGSFIIAGSSAAAESTANDLHIVCGNSGDSAAASVAARGGFVFLDGGIGGDAVAADAAATAGDGGGISLEAGRAGDANAGTGATGGVISFRTGQSSDGGNDGALLLAVANGGVVPITIGNGSAEIGFYGVTPVVRSSAYTPTNVVTDRAYDANATTLAELADVVGTMIADLQATGIIA